MYLYKAVNGQWIAEYNGITYYTLTNNVAIALTKVFATLTKTAKQAA